jgi:hypothetical protein
VLAGTKDARVQHTYKDLLDDKDGSSSRSKNKVNPDDFGNVDRAPWACSAASAEKQRKKAGTRGKARMQVSAHNGSQPALGLDFWGKFQVNMKKKRDNWGQDWTKLDW